MRPADASEAVALGGGGGGGAAASGARQLPIGTIVRWAIILGFAVVVPLIVEGLPEYYLVLCIDAGIAAILLRSLGVLIDRAGLLAICPLAFAAVGAYTVGYCNVHGWPGGLFFWMFLGGVAAIPVGLLVALPALRVRGINLAVITLSFGAALASLSSPTSPRATSHRTTCSAQCRSSTTARSSCSSGACSSPSASGSG